MKPYHQIMSDEHEAIIAKMPLSDAAPDIVTVPFGVNGRLRNEFKRRNISFGMCYEETNAQRILDAQLFFANVVDPLEVPMWASIEVTTNVHETLAVAKKMIELGEYNPALLKLVPTSESMDATISETANELKLLEALYDATISEND